MYPWITGSQLFIIPWPSGTFDYAVVVVVNVLIIITIVAVAAAASSAAALLLLSALLILSFTCDLSLNGGWGGP